MSERLISNSANNSILLSLFSVNFIGALGFSLVMPFLVFVVSDFGGNAIIYGIVGASYSFFQLIGAPLIGKYSDRVGRKRALFLSQFGTLLAWLILLLALLLPKTDLANINSNLLGQFTLTLPLLVLFLARSLDGLTGGNISVANAYLVDLSTEENQSQNFGKMATSSNLGFIIGPVLAGLLGATVYKEVIPVSIAALISLVGLILIFVVLPETKPTPVTEPPCKNPHPKVLGKETKDCFADHSKQHTISEVLKIKKVPITLLLYFLIFVAFNLFYVSFPVHATQTLQWSATQLGLFFSFVSGMMILAQGPLLKHLNQTLSSEKITLIGCTLMIISFLLFSLPHLLTVYLSALFFALGNGIMWPSFMSLLGHIGSKEQQGTIQGVATSSGSLASIVGLLAGGMLYSTFGTVTFIIGASFFLASLIIMLLTFKK